ncbi:hypothetical protein, partial [Leptospira weilii]
FYWRSIKLNVSLLLALDKTQRLASIGARRAWGRAVSLFIKLKIEPNEVLRYDIKFPLYSGS